MVVVELSNMGPSAPPVAIATMPQTTAFQPVPPQLAPPKHTGSH